MSSYQVVREDNVKETAQEFKALFPSEPDLNNLEEDFKQTEMRDQYIILVTDDTGTWWRYIASNRYAPSVIFEIIKRELRLT